MEQPKTFSIVLVSPDLEKLHASAIMGSGAAMAGMDVNIFVTMEALRAFLKKTIEQRSFVKSGIGATLLDKKVPLFYQLFQQAKELGKLHIYACAMSADIMGWKKEDMVDVIDDIIGVNKFFSLSMAGPIVTM
jgi:peroxiredoxin family protein